MLSNIIPAGPEFRANSYTLSDQGSAAIAMDADGDFVIAWRSGGQDGSGNGIFAQRYDASGLAQGEEFRVNTQTINSQHNPAIAMDAQGNFVIVWTGPGLNAISDIFAQRFNAAGSPQGGEFRVNTTTAEGQFSPAVAMNASGSFVVVWINPGVQGQRYNSAGVPQGGEFRIDTEPGYVGSPSIAMGPGGDFVIAWSNLVHPSPRLSDVHARFFNSDAIPRTNEFVVNTYTTNSQSSPSIAMDAMGNCVIAWTGLVQEPSATIFAQRFSASGVAQGEEFRVSDFMLHPQQLPTAAMDADGDFVIAWQSYTQDGSHYGVYAKRYDSAGVAHGAAFRVNSYTTDRQSDATIASDASGDFAIAWVSQSQDGDGYGVYAQRFAVVPEVISSSFLFESSPSPAALSL